LVQKKWYLENKDNFEKFYGKWIGLCKNTLVFAVDYDELSNELRKFEGTGIRPLLILVGSEAKNPAAEILPLQLASISEPTTNPKKSDQISLQTEILSVHNDQITIDTNSDSLFKSHEETPECSLCPRLQYCAPNLDAITRESSFTASWQTQIALKYNKIQSPEDSLSFESIAHAREFEEDPDFRTECRYQTQQPPFDKFFFRRPLVSTLVQARCRALKIISFIIATGSPFTYLSKRSIQNLGWNEKQPHFDFWEGQAYLGSVFGSNALFRVSRSDYKNVNILGNDILRNHVVSLRRNKIIWDSYE